MSSSISSWLKVAQGFKLVAQAASKIAIEEGSTVAAQASRHSIDLAKNARNATAHVATTTTTAAAAATSNFSNNVMNDGVSISAVGISTTSNDAPYQIKADVVVDVVDVDVVDVDDDDDGGGGGGGGGDHQTMSLASDEINSSQTTIEGKSHGIQSKNSNHKSLHSVETNSINNNDNDEQSVQEIHQQRKLKEGQAVPSTRIGRALGFASLGKSFL